jgi:hypothetical protein
MRWFTDFEHIVFYAEIKLFTLSFLLIVMWILVEPQIQLAPLYN